MRALEHDDLPFAAKLFANATLVRSFLGAVPLPLKNDELAARLLKNDRDRYHLVLDRETNEPVGIAGIQSYFERHRSYRCSVCIAAEQQGRGFGFDALAVMFDFMFAQLGAHRVFGMFVAGNARRERHMEGLGCRRAGVFREMMYFEGRYHDGIAWVLDRESFYAACDERLSRART